MLRNRARKGGLPLRTSAGVTDGAEETAERVNDGPLVGQYDGWTRTPRVETKWCEALKSATGLQRRWSGESTRALQAVPWPNGQVKRRA